MKSIRRNLFRRQKKIILAALLLVFITTFSYVTVINPLFSHAEARYMTATITDDNGTVDFSPGINDAVANFSYVHSGSNVSDSDIYSAKIVLRGLPTDSNKKLVISLPIGMAWVDDASNDQNVLSQLDSSKGTNGVEQIKVAHEAVKNYMFPNTGDRIYYIADGAVAITLNLKVKADSNISLGEVKDAIKASLFTGDTLIESGSVDVEVPTGISQPGAFIVRSRTLYVKPGSTYSGNIAEYRRTYAWYVVGYFGVSRLVESVQYTMHVNNSEARVALADDATAEWSIDTSDAANNNYVFTYTPTKVASSSLFVPYVLVVPGNISVGESITVTSTGVTNYWQPDGTIAQIPFSNSSVITYTVLPETTNGVTVGFDTLDPSSNSTAKDVTYASPLSEGEYMTGLLGQGFINNRSATDSSPKRVRLIFDTESIGVMQVKLSCRPNSAIDTIHVESKSGISKDVNVNLSCNAYGGTNPISYVDFGLDRFDYISKLEYNIGSIPAATQLHWANINDSLQAIVFMGRRLNADTDAISTIEIFDVDNPENTTGIGKMITTTGRSVGADVGTMATQVVNAGQSLKFKTTISDYGGTMVSYRYAFSNPIIYIRSEVKDANGNFLPISNIKVTNGTARDNQDITAKFGQIETFDTETARIYKLDSSAITDGSASLTSSGVSSSGQLASNQLQVAFDINTDLTTPDQTYDIKGLVLVEASDKGAITSRSNRGDIYNVTGNSNTIYAATTNYYQIRGWASIGVENAGKHTSSDTWLTWSEESNPITIGSTEGSLADMKATMINNSGVAVPGPTTIYFPIPKKKQDWNSLSYNNQDFEFSTALTGAISNPNNNYFVISYGKDVTPSDNGTNLEAENAKFTTNTSGWTASDWEDVNCIKITATNIPANQPGVADNYDFIYKLKVVDATNASDGAINTWRPLYFQQLTNSAGDIFAGWYKGSYVSVKLADGKISGQLFIDTNENGKKDSSEQDLKEAGWEIDLYDKASNRLVRSTTTDANGKYNFIELAMNADGYYITVTNKHPINGTGTTYLFTQKGAVSNSGAYNTDNQAEGSKTSTPAHATAHIGPVSPSQTTGEATYNIGLVTYEATEKYSGQISFSDQNNRFNTRPATIAIKATDNDGTVTNISVPTTTSDNGAWSKKLPKYNARGEKLSYTFSSPDQTNYTKSDQQVNTYTYNTSYTQKTATLTVNHYKKGTTESLAPTATSTVYWGQSYMANQATVDSNYEYDSVTGTTSGTISGNVTVTYYYKLKTGTITTHYYIKDTTTKIAPDNVQTKNYTETYTTSPLASIPAAYQNYELVSEQPEGYTGTVSKPNTEVIYYYQKKNPNLSSDVSIQAPESVSSKTETIPYEIKYSANIKDYIGELNITIVDKLPYPIVVDGSELDGGIYDAEARTITWIVTKDYNSYTDGEEINIAHNINLVYDGVKANDSLSNTVEANVSLGSVDNDAGDSAITIVKTPAKIIYRFTDSDGNEIQREVEDEGYVGEQSDFEPPEIPGYRLIKDNNIDLRFGEEEHTVIYRYEKLPEPVSPTTGDNIVIYFTLLCGLIAASGLIVHRCKYLKR